MCRLGLCRFSLSPASFSSSLARSVVRAFAGVFAASISQDLRGDVDAGDVVSVGEEGDPEYLEDVGGRVLEMVAERGGR